MNLIGPTIQRGRSLEALAWLTGFAGLVWFAVYSILSGDPTSQDLTALVVTGIIIVLVTLSNWRVGVYLLVVWLVFEDFARKFLGNNMFVYFGKDILVAVMYVAFLYRLRKHLEKRWRPPFGLPLVLFLGWAAIEAFNPLSASMSYGFLGLKLYFYYIPLMFTAYALLRTELDLRRFLVFNLALGGVISLLGVIQAITGQRFLNPEVLDEDLVALGNLNRYSPISGLVFNRPTSVFVSDGRFGSYLILMWILSFGTISYLMLGRRRSGKLMYLCAAAVLAAIMLSGVRTALVYSLIGTAVMVAGLIWATRLRKEQVLRTFKAIRRFVLLSSVGGVCVALLYPEALASRWAFYMETLSPSGTASELTTRGWEYPLSEFLKAFTMENWGWGRGLGTASLGSQYLTRILNARAPGPAVENGYGALLLEMGIPGLVLWIIMTIAIARSCWKVVKQLRATPMFPLAFGIFWFVFIVFFPLSFIGLTTYQDFIINAYLWILIGVLFRLPSIAAGETIKNSGALS